jgi:hypothetical protein
MKSEPLNINDKTFLINRLIEQAPTDTLIREFFKNAEESARTAEPGNRLIKIYPTEIDGIPKLTFWNTGTGMDANELRLATDLSSSIGKEMSLDGNFGIGAKVSGLAVSKAGIRYRSCKNGEVNEVTIGYDEDEGTYVRFPAQLADGTFETVYDITSTLAEAGQNLSYDWTEVVLFGENEHHNTVAEPLASGKQKERSYIASSIFRRFSKFSEGIEVRIDVSMTKGGGKNETGRSRALKTLEEVIDHLPNHQRVKSESGNIVIHYIHDPKHEKHSHSLSALANPATSSTTFCALVHKGERYDFKSRNKWSAAAPNFGIPFGSKVISIEIEIADELALPNQYRDGLTWPEDRSQMVAMDFDNEVRSLMPDWVKEVIKAESPQSDERMDDLQSDLQKLLDEFRIPTVTLSPTKSSSDLATTDATEGTDTASVIDGISLEPDDVPFGGAEHRELQSLRAKNKKVRRAPDGARPSKSSLALERVPEIKVLTELEQVLEKNLKGRAARYYKDAQTLFVNGLYSVVDRMAAELEVELRNEAEAELLRSKVVSASRRFMAFRVGKATCYAISKRLADDWSGDDLDRATSPESLSLAADDYKQSLKAAKKWVKEQIKSETMDQIEEAALQ